MEEYLSFAQAHPLLVFGFIGLLGLIAWTEYNRVNRKYALLNTNEAVRLLNNDDTVIVDVREDKELSSGKIKGAKHIPISNFATRVNELKKYKQNNILVYCGSGNRSLHACNILAKEGFEKISNLAGGLMSWKSANLPLSNK